MSPRDEVGVVDGWQQTPQTIYLGVVPVEFRHGQEDGPEEDGECKARNEGIRALVECKQCIRVSYAFGQFCWQLIQLRKIWLDCFRIVGAFLERLDQRKTHCDASSWILSSSGVCSLC